MSEDPIKITHITVTVNRMPRYCHECPMLVMGASFYCAAINIMDNGTDPSLGKHPFDMPFRRHDCPLIVEPESAYAWPYALKEKSNKE